MTAGWVYVADDADELKWNAVPEGEYAATIDNLEAGRSKGTGAPQVTLDVRLVSEHSEINNTSVTVWFTYSGKAMSMARQKIRGVLGPSKLEHGQSCTFEEMVDLCKEMQWIDGNDDVATGTKRDILVYIDHRIYKGEKQNNITWMKALSDSWEEPNREETVERLASVKASRLNPDWENEEPF